MPGALWKIQGTKIKEPAFLSGNHFGDMGFYPLYRRALERAVSAQSVIALLIDN